MTRNELLQHTQQLLYGPREDDYGTPLAMCSRIAEYWSIYLDMPPDAALKAHDVAAMMVLLKVARMSAGNTPTTDSWADIAGYAAIGEEVQNGTIEEE